MEEPGIVVVGGGWAGLSCATALAERGRPVTLLEERRHLGGRACSFLDAFTGDEVDNGQHLFLSCFSEALRFLRRIGTAGGIRFQRRLEISLAEPAGRRSTFRCPALPSPLHLLGGVLGHRGLSAMDKLRLVAAWRGMRGEIEAWAAGDGAGERGGQGDGTVDAWLDAHGQTPGSRRGLWHPLATATLNEDPSRASSRLFAAVLKQGLLGGPAGSRLGLAQVPLSGLVEPAARRYLEERGGRVIPKASVLKLGTDRGGGRGVRLRDGSEIRASAVVSAVAQHDLPGILPEQVPADDPFFGGSRGLGSSPILSVHLWLDRPVLASPFLGLLDSPIHWVFDAGREGDRATPPRRVTLITSGAQDLVKRPGAEILDLALGELRRYLPAARSARLLHSRIIKERAATFMAQPGACRLRPGHATPIPNLFLSGDWTDTGLPGTLESAALSGHRCADLLAAGPGRAA
mgnify:CR=1 FL=1